MPQAASANRQRWAHVGREAIIAAQVPSSAMAGRRGAALFILPFDESGEGIEILLQHLLHRFLGEIALVVEGIADTVQIDFRLPQDRATNARQDRKSVV